MTGLIEFLLQSLNLFVASSFFIGTQTSRNRILQSLDLFENVVSVTSAVVLLLIILNGIQLGETLLVDLQGVEETLGLSDERLTSIRFSAS